MSTDVSIFDDDLLSDLFDPGSLTRGRAYAADGRAHILKSVPGVIDALCHGSGRSEYLVRIRWEPGRLLLLRSSCTCPIGGDCKHCVAAILTARKTAAPSASWRKALAELAVVDPDHQAPSEASVALQIVLEHPKPSRFVRQAGPRLTIRPLRRSRTGRWVKTGAAWRDFASAYGFDHRFGGPSVDPHQLEAVRALARSSRSNLSYLNSQAAALETFGPEMWQQLERAIEAGVVLVGEHPDEQVALSAAPARPVVDLVADDDGTITISVGFHVNDVVLPAMPHHGGVIGSPGHGLWSTNDGQLALHPLAGPLHPTIARLVTEGGITVPASDADELLDVYQPVLARHAVVGSSDGSVAISTPRFDGLTLTVERHALDMAALRWSVRYQRGERTVLHPLTAARGPARDRATEAAAIESLELPTHLLDGLVRTDGLPADIFVTGRDAVTLQSDVLPWIETKCDVDIVVHGDLPLLREAVDDPLIALTVRDGDDDGSTDWFDLAVEVSVDGEHIDFATLFTALTRDEELLILPSGTWLRLDRPEFARLRELIEEARGLAEPAGDGTVRLNRFQTSWWDELASLGVVTEQSRRWAQSIGQMASLTTPEPIDPPVGLRAELRPYQQEGLDWLGFLHRHGLGGVLADDMGLGKTVQTLALCLHVLDRDPDARFLVIAPTSVVDNWAREAARFAPELRVCTIAQTESRRGSTLAEAIADAHLVVTSYALFRLEFEHYAAHDWELLLLDEAQFVKNHQSKTYQCVRRLGAASKIAITGTPLENTLMDLWSLLSISAPGLYPDPQRFSETYRRPIESGRAPERLAVLRRRIAPLMRRRTKDEVLTELPPKTEQVVEVQLNSRHARIYQTQLQRERQKVLGLVGDVQKHRFEIFRSLTLLRQLALDPGLTDPAHDRIGSAKLDRLLEDLTQVVAEGHRALVFSQFTRYLERVRGRLDDAGIAHTYLDGRTRKRDQAIARFKDGDVPVFVISLKAGGFGLNLTEADYCFILDPWWNPATETQAVDRTHRIGQTNPVMVYRYVSTDTIEEKVMELKARKADLFANVIDAEGALSGALTELDIRGLLDLD